VTLRVPFLDLGAASRELELEQRAAIERVVASGTYVLGPEVERFEADFAAAAGAAHAVGVGNGLDALRLTLQALGIGPGDEVIVPSHTFVATWLAVAATGARIVPVEPDAHPYLIGTAAVAAAITPRTAAIVPVHLYGEPADMPSLARLAARHSLALVADAAQAHGAQVGGHPAGAWGDASTWSFYPAKNLGALGDGGAVTTDDAVLAARLRRLRNYGSETKYVHLEAGVNSRLDELQAAVLGVRLAVLETWNERRRQIAERYADGLAGTGLHLPAPAAGHAWHLYVVETPRREALAATLGAAGVGTLVHYPVPCHRQAAFAGDEVAALHLPVAARLAAGVLSLPIGPHLSPVAADHVIAVVRSASLARAA
jgi:dTDP-3-amino-3,4,6-trideoxy-alpha-D-glucose transaminase